jgi:pyruvate dehydrogenase E2 component (dihydrolipoamide acetyltransferase)
MTDILLPSLGPEMESGKLLRWLVKPGDIIHKGTIIAVVDTTKSAIDVESWHAGRVEALLVQPGDVVAVGTTILRLAGAAEPLAAPAAPTAPAAMTAPPAAVTLPQPSAGGEHVRASPAARKRAAELGVALARLTGTGPDGAITVGDVNAAVPPPPATPPATSSAPEDRRAGVRAAIAASMARSHREIPHYYLWDECDVSRALQWMQQQNAARPVDQRLVLAALLAAAVARAAREFPDMNGTYENGQFHSGAAVNLGVAVALRGGGLIAPAIVNAHALSLDQIMQQLSDLVRRARSGGLRSSEVSGQTLTITQLGDEGVQGILGIIHPPQVALIGIGTPRERALAVDGQVMVRTCVTISLSADHRVSDGRRGAQFLNRIAALLQEPEKL